MGDHSASRTSASLIARLGRAPDDAAAWDAFVRRYGRKVYQWCQHWGLQPADAEDVTQSVLLEVVRQMKTFAYDPARSFRGWLRAVAHGAWCDFLTKRNRPGLGTGSSAVRDRLAAVEAGDDLVRRLAEEFDTELLEEAMARVRARVEERTWEAFRLLAVEGLTGAQVADRLGMKVATVFVARSKVQKMIRDEVRALDGPGEGEE
jgi:RNA polymerase sigma-70 factor (ECF subfamily)